MNVASIQQSRAVLSLTKQPRSNDYLLNHANDITIRRNRIKKYKLKMQFTFTCDESEGECRSELRRRCDETSALAKSGNNSALITTIHTFSSIFEQ